MSSERKPRPPVPPKKQRSLSERSEFDQDGRNLSGDVDSRNFQTLPSAGIQNLREKISERSPPRDVFPIFEEAAAVTKQAPPPDDCTTVLNLPPVEPQTFLEDEAPVFYSSSSLPSKTSQRDSSCCSDDASDCSFQYVRQASDESRSRSIPDYLEEAGCRRRSEATTNAVLEEVNDNFLSNSSASSRSIRIEPSPERTLGPSHANGFASDPDSAEVAKSRAILRSDPDESGSIKSVKGRGLRPSMLMLSKSTNALANLGSPEEKKSKNKKKVDIEKLNRFFGESKETATDLETNIYHMLMSGSQLKEPSPGGDGHKAKKSASTWFLTQKGLESLPQRPLDAQAPKSKRFITDKDELLGQKLKDGFADRGKKIMKSFRRRVIGPTTLADGALPTEEVQKTFEMHLEHCVMSSANKFVPLLVERCVGIVEELGLDVEGIYRLSGNGAAITELQEELDKEPFVIDTEHERWNEVHVVSNLLKLFFRKLPDSLVTDDLYDSMICISRIGHREKRLLKLKVLLEKLPKVNFETFKFLSRHLHKVASLWDVNKMDAHNLAIMFGPTLIRSPKDQTLVMIKDMNDQTTIVETIIKHNKWLFGGWTEDRSVPSDEVAPDVGPNMTSNLQLLANAETLVARQLRVLPAEDEPSSSSSFFTFQGPNRRSKRKHRSKSTRDLTDGGEQATAVAAAAAAAALDAEREIEVRRIKVPDLPFKRIGSPSLNSDPFNKTLLDGRSKVKRSATERLDAKTLDIRLVSNKFEENRESMAATMSKPTEEMLRRNSEKAARLESEVKNPDVVDGRRTEAPPVFEIKKYRAYDHDSRVSVTSAQSFAMQPTLLKKYSARSQQMGTYNPNHGSLKKEAAATSTLKSNNVGWPSVEKENKRPDYASMHRPMAVPGYHPDVSDLELDSSTGAPYWEGGSLEKKTNIVVRGPLGRRYCVLSGTDPSVFLKSVPPSRASCAEDDRQVSEFLDKRQCMMTCVINVRLEVIRGKTGPSDIELRRVKYQ